MRARSLPSVVLLLVIGCGDKQGAARGGADAALEGAGDAQVDAEVEPDIDAARGAGQGGADAEVDAGAPTDADTAAAADASDGQLDGAASCDGAAGCGGGDACVARTETCDGTDDDCDGEVDEGCYEAPFGIMDFDVTDDGRAVAVGVVGQRIRMVCFAADGTVAKAAFEVAAPELPSLTLSHVDVARADASGNVALSYSYWNFPSSPNDWRTYAVFFDAQCDLARAGAALDADLPNTGVVRQASLSMTDDGRSYFLYEHQTEGVFRALGFDASGARIAAVTIPSDTECFGGALSRVLALDEASGKFAVICERDGRIYRRYGADGAPTDPSFVTIPGYPSSAPFHYFGGALNADGVLLYFGRRAQDARWIWRIFDGASVLEGAFDGATGDSDPQARVTAGGNFLIALSGAGYDVALVSATGGLLEGLALGSSAFELVGENRLYTLQDNQIVRAPAVDLGGR